MSIPFEIGEEIIRGLKDKPLTKEELYSDFYLMCFEDDEIRDWIATNKTLEKIEVIDNKFYYNYRQLVAMFQGEEIKKAMVDILKERELLYRTIKDIKNTLDKLIGKADN